jgi:hypothetical protein
LRLSLQNVLIRLTNSTGDRGARHGRLKPHQWQYCRLLQEEAERASEDAAFLLMGIYTSSDAAWRAMAERPSLQTPPPETQPEDMKDPDDREFRDPNATTLVPPITTEVLEDSSTIWGKSKLQKLRTAKTQKFNSCDRNSSELKKEAFKVSFALIVSIFRPKTYN